jgi:hypothetical protein
MFVRYRKIVSDGQEPLGVSRGRNCPGMCRSRYPSRDGRCPKKPRCRWRIGLLELADPLVPYRLHVSLAENHREAGRVRQQHVADLGSVDGWRLAEFWEGLDPTLVARIKQDNWDLASVLGRAAFWETAKPRLDRLANRLDPKAVRMAIHRRIPWPMQKERDLAEARESFRDWQGVNRMITRDIQHNDETIAKATAKNAKLRQEILDNAPHVAAAMARLAKSQS